MNVEVSVAVAAFVDGLMAGVFVGSGLIEQAAKGLNGSAWILYKQAKERVLGRAGPPLLLAAIAASLAAAVLAQPKAPSAAATVLLLGVLAVTVAIHVPLNRAINGLAPDDPSPTWALNRDRWRRWHWFRTGLAVAAFALATVALART